MTTFICETAHIDVIQFRFKDLFILLELDASEVKNDKLMMYGHIGYHHTSVFIFGHQLLGSII